MCCCPFIEQIVLYQICYFKSSHAKDTVLHSSGHIIAEVKFICHSFFLALPRPGLPQQFLACDSLAASVILLINMNSAILHES